MVMTPERVGAVYAIVQEELRVHAWIRIHTGKTEVRNRAGVRPEASEQGLKILGTPLGHPDFVERHLDSVCRCLRGIVGGVQ